MSHSGDVCEVHGVGYEHRPRSEDVERHHVWPLGMGGPDVPANMRDICPTGHSNIHHLLRHYVRGNGVVPWEVRRRFTVGERELAELGYRAVMGNPEARAFLGAA